MSVYRFGIDISNRIVSANSSIFPIYRHAHFVLGESILYY